MELAEIIQKCCDGSEKAQRELYRQYASMIMRICRRYTRSSFEAEDVFQEAFITIFRKIDQYKEKEGKGNFEGWLYRITVNCSLKYIRKHIKKRSFEVDEKEETPPDPGRMPDHLSVEELQELIDQLPEGQKVIFNLYAIDGYRHDEIAGMMNITVGTSRSQLKKARNTLIRFHHEINKLNG